jgi:tripartite-type tricarboxylate transporter receptor subunit TctC
MVLATIRAFLLAWVALAAAPALAQEWPTKPVKFVVPFPPGGSVDPLARLVGVVTEWLSNQFIVENKPGASGSIGAAQVAKSPADGYRSCSYSTRMRSTGA